MLKFYLYSIMLLLFITNCSRNTNKEKAALNKSDPVGVYGDKIDLKTVTSIDQLLTHSDLYIDKSVLINGTISAVCPMRGCWVDVKSTETDSGLRLKVTDGEIVFPLSGKGQNIKAEGIFQKLDFTYEQAMSRKIHFAEEKGITLHPDSVHITPEDLTSYRVYVSGAVIE